MADPRGASPTAVARLRNTQGAHPWTRTESPARSRNVKGAAKEAIGKAIGDAKLQSDGKTDKAVGKIQNAVGGLNDAVSDAVKK